MRSALLLLLILAVAGCDSRQEECSDPPAPIQGVSYQIVDAATGTDWFASPGRPAGDSLKLLTSPGGLSLVAAERVASGFRVGPVYLTNGTSTHYLCLSSSDIDTVQMRVEYANGPKTCFPLFERIEFTYNGRLNGTYQAGVRADSIEQFTGAIRPIRLLKR